MSIDTVKVEKLVREYLAAQSLTVFPQTLFGDAVSQFIDKDDKHAMELFVDTSLSSQIKKLLEIQGLDEDNTTEAMDKIRADMDRQAEAGQLKNSRKRKMKPKPADWDSDLEGSWADQPAAVVLSENEAGQSDEEANSVAASTASRSTATRGRGRGRGKATGTTRTSTTTSRSTAKTSKAPAKVAKGGRGKKSAVSDEDDDEDEDVIMVDEDDDEDEDVEPQPRHHSNATNGAASKTTSRSKAAPVKKTPARAATNKQTVLDFSQPSARPSNGRKTYQEIVSPFLHWICRSSLKDTC